MEKPKILIVDDDPNKILVIKSILSEMDIELITCNSGKDALRLILNTEYAAILLDVNMPVMDGYETAALIRKRNKSKRIPIIFITAVHQSNEDIFKGYSAGAVDYIVTPIIPEVLRSKINVFVELYDSRREIEEKTDELKLINEDLESRVKERTAKIVQSAEEIKKANRIYAVLSKINRTIVRVKDKKALFDDACSIAVEEGKFKMTWIGMVDKKTNKVNPVASTGFTDDYLKTINIDLIDDKLSNGPTGRAIKTGVYYIACDIANNPEMIPWRENALRLGYKSSAAFPIMVFGKTIGAFSLYSNEKFFFDEAEVNLLDELAKDISFAIEFIETEFARKKKEEELRLAGKIMHNMDKGVYLLRVSDGIIVYTNPKFDKMFGYAAGELMGKHVSIINAPEDKTPSKIEEEIITVLKNDMVWNGEVLNIKKDGTTFWTSANISTFKHEKHGDLWISVHNDITERKKAEEELIKAKENAEEMNKVKNCFLANMSHELRTPLISILGFAELLQQELEKTEHLEFVNHIMEGGQRLNNTLSGILEFSKLETSNSFLRLQPHKLADEIEAVVKTFLPKVQSKRLFLKSELNHSHLHAHIDCELFGKALFHLVNNGIKFTKEGGVLVTLNHERKQNRDWAVTKVIDTGIGIPKKDFGKIFGEFRQASEGYSRSHEGTGLGLTVTKKIAELMKGKIEVESEVGKGSTFSILLPAVFEESQINKKVEELRKTTIIEPPTAKERGLKKILIVDDNESNRLFINRSLSSYVRIIEAEDGIMGVTLALKERFDLILMDINLGAGIDGITAMHQIRKIPGYMHVPIIAVTAYVMFGDNERFLEEGFDDYLAKPFMKDDLVSLVEKTLSRVKKWTKV